MLLSSSSSGPLSTASRLPWLVYLRSPILLMVYAHFFLNMQVERAPLSLMRARRLPLPRLSLE